LFGGAKPNKAPRGDGTGFKLLFNKTKSFEKFISGVSFILLNV